MDFSQIANLLPEFLQNFKGDNSKNLPGILSAISNTDMLEGFIGEKYSKYLPLLPLLGKLSTEGFKGLLTDTDAISAVLSVISGSGAASPEILKGVNLDALLPLLPMFLSLFKKGGESTLLPVALENINDRQNAAEEKPPKANVTYDNPLAPISGFANRDIIYMLNKYISDAQSG